MNKRSTRKGFAKGFLDRLYPIPNALDTEAQWLRRMHADLEGTDRSSLLADRQLLRLRMLLDRPPDAWLLERAAALEEALHRAG